MHANNVFSNGETDLMFSARIDDDLTHDDSVAKVTALLQRLRSALEDLQITEIANQRASDSCSDEEAYVQAEKQQQQQQLREQYQMRLRYLEWLQRFVKKQELVLLRLQQVTDFPQSKLSAEQNVIENNPVLLDSLKMEKVECETSKSHMIPTLHEAKEPRSPLGDLALQRDALNSGDSTDYADLKIVECRDPDGVTPIMSDTGMSSVAQQVLESGIQWQNFRTWQPSQVSLLANVVQPSGGESSPVRHILCLSTVVCEKPRGIRAKDAALHVQGRYCKSCLSPLRKRHFPFPSWKAARFCYYTGMYYCTRCHTGKKSVIPARVLHSWDFEPQPVCNEALDFLELQRDRPLYFVSAVNPALYHQVQLLYMLRFMRLQVVALREVGIQCHVFRHLFYGENASGQLNSDEKKRVGSSNSTDIPSYKLHIKSFVPNEKRYLMEDSEVWSLADLEDIWNCEREEFMRLVTPPSIALMEESAYNRVLTVIAGKCKSALFLKRLRAHMVYHILQKRCAVCVRNSLDLCRWCSPPDILAIFEQRKELEKSQGQKDDTGITTSSLFAISSSMVSSQDSSDEMLTIAPHLYSVWSFDLVHVRACPSCGACYHKRCFYKLQKEMSGVMWCRRCFPNRLINRNGNNSGTGKGSSNNNNDNGKTNENAALDVGKCNHPTEEKKISFKVSSSTCSNEHDA
ncbi:putative zinc-RING and/or ribbon [Trypanosoma melophagium]|uniref:putative zinc-RING and/or ribbon n=1 Tax=Trypanosoma melophagium TaxID=715481 RepID=UPI00351A4DA7|nr:putative zinc-RING and/or ribbon [Trypanosoma melophagium]